jgi:hypothetical protein
MIGRYTVVVMIDGTVKQSIYIDDFNRAIETMLKLTNIYIGSDKSVSIAMSGNSETTAYTIEVQRKELAL